MINNWMLETPPRLDQHNLYSFPESQWACWAACAEMIIKWKSRSSYFARPRFDPPSLAKTDAGMDDRIRYFLYQERFFDSWGFEAQAQASHGALSFNLVATLLKEKGPLLCYGKYLASADALEVGGLAHAIVVYGCSNQFGGIHYIDPWDSMTKKISLNSFATKLSPNAGAILARKPNYRS